MAAIYQRLQFRRGQAGHFAAHNPILASGEPAFTMDTLVMKVGNGNSRWNDLPVFSSGVSDAAGATFAQLTTVSGMLDIASGIAVYSSGQQGLDVSKINAVSGIASTASGISIFASGQTILVTASSGALNTSVGLLEVSSGNLNTSVGLLEVASGDLNTRLHTVSGIAGAGGVDGINAASGIAATASGISVFASGQVSLLPADSNSTQVVPINIDNLSGLAVSVGPHIFPTFIYKPSGQTLNKVDEVNGNDLKLGSVPLGGWRAGSLGQISTTSSGISFFGSGQSLTNTDDILIVSGIAEAGGGGGATASQLNGVSGVLDVVSGVAIFASGQSLSGGGGDVSTSQLTGVSGIADTASGISVFASGQTIINTSNVTVVSGVSIASESGTYGNGNISYNSTASGNISGVNNILLVDQAAFNALNKDSNTLYFIPSGV